MLTVLFTSLQTAEVKANIFSLPLSRVDFFFLLCTQHAQVNNLHHLSKPAIIFIQFIADICGYKQCTRHRKSKISFESSA